MRCGFDKEGASFFEEKLGYFFRDRKLLKEALTHASFANESGLSSFNERMEYLGDAVLELCVSEILYASFPECDEGELTKARAAIVCESSLAEWARWIDLPSHLRLGKGLERQNGRQNSSVLSDALEAVFGAIFLDGGYEAASRTISRLVESMEERRTDRAEKDAKSRLQELFQCRGEKPPRYRLIAQSGPDHRISFVVEVHTENETLATGHGNSIKSAEFRAAESALSKMKDSRGLQGKDSKS